jgi:hypothetical protein
MSDPAQALADTLIARMLGALSQVAPLRLPLAPHEVTNLAALKLVVDYFKNVGAVGWSQDRTHLLFTPGVIFAESLDAPLPAIVLSHVCRACDTSFDTLTALAHHRCGLHHCDQCTDFFTTAIGLGVHKGRKHPARARTFCSKCQTEFARPARLDEHKSKGCTGPRKRAAPRELDQEEGRPGKRARAQ